MAFISNFRQVSLNSNLQWELIKVLFSIYMNYK